MHSIRDLVRALRYAEADPAAARQRYLTDLFHQQDISSTWPITSADASQLLGYIDLAQDPATTPGWYWRRCDERGFPLDTRIHGPYHSRGDTLSAATRALSSTKEQ